MTQRIHIGQDTPPTRAERVLSIPRWAFLALTVVAQVALALTIQALPVLALVQAAAIAGAGFYSILRRDLPMLLVLMAYVTGSELLWRQVRAPVFYQAAPYLIITFSVLAVVLVLGRIGKNSRLALLYVALLLPAMVTTIRMSGVGSRELIAFALSGPVSLGVLIAFTSQITVSPWLYRRLLWSIVVSAVGPLTIALADTRTTLAARGAIDFKSSSNFVTSGGFGPVQVSSLLSAGVLAAILLILSEPAKTVRFLAGLLGFVMVVQTLLTFSRGGITSISIAIAGLAVASARNRRVRRRILFVAGISLMIGYFVVLPWLEVFTHGAFSERYSDTTSGRTELAANDLQIFEDNFIFGVGPGMTKYQRLTYEVCQVRADKCREEASSHTEFTRMLGEHGIPGAVAIGLLIWLAANAYRRRGRGRVLAATWILWSISQMFYANFRIVAVPFMFAFAFLRLEDSDDDDDADTGHDGSTTPANQWDADPPGRKRTVGFGAGYGPSAEEAPPGARPIGFGAGLGPPNLIDRSVQDPL